MLLATAPWYEFWARGVWKHGEWTHLHASGWVWAVRGDLLLGLLVFLVLVVGMSGEVSGFGFAFASGFLALLIVIPGVSQLVAAAAFFMPAFIVVLLIWSGWDQLAKVWRGRGDESKVTPPPRPGP